MNSNHFYGGKIIGAGGGGFYLMVFKNKKKGKHFLKKNGLSYLDFKFSDSGSKVIYKKY